MYYPKFFSDDLSKRVRRLHCPDGSTMIMKYCRIQDPEYKKYRQGFMLEYQYMCELSHPGLPAYYYLQTTDSRGNLQSFSTSGLTFSPGFMTDSTFLLMEDFSPDENYQTLYSFLNEYDDGRKSPVSRLSNDVILRILSELSEILHYLRVHGILYMDLNPDNILVNQSMHLKLIDHTFCRYIDSNAIPDKKLRYMPKCCGNLTDSFYRHYQNVLKNIDADELLTAVFSEFFTHLFFKSRDDYRQNYRIQDMLTLLKQCGYTDSRIFSDILNTSSRPIPSDYRLKKFDSWYILLKNQLAR